MSRPSAAEERWIMQAAGEELLVYDRVRHRAYCLSRAAARVWREASAGAERLNDGSSAEPDGQVAETLLAEEIRYQLSQRALLPADPSAPPSATRRELLRQAGLWGAAAGAVLAVTAPVPAQAASCITLATCNAATVGMCCRRFNGSTRLCRLSFGFFLCNGDDCSCT